VQFPIDLCFSGKMIFQEIRTRLARKVEVLRRFTDWLQRDLQEAYNWVEEHRRGREQYFLQDVDLRGPLIYLG
jgi:hypothetical protein